MKPQDYRDKIREIVAFKYLKDNEPDELDAKERFAIKDTKKAKRPLKKSPWNTENQIIEKECQ